MARETPYLRRIALSGPARANAERVPLLMPPNALLQRWAAAAPPPPAARAAALLPTVTGPARVAATRDTVPRSFEAAPAVAPEPQSAARPRPAPRVPAVGKGDATAAPAGREPGPRAVAAPGPFAPLSAASPVHAEPVATAPPRRRAALDPAGFAAIPAPGEAEPQDAQPLPPAATSSSQVQAGREVTTAIPLLEQHLPWSQAEPVVSPGLPDVRLPPPGNPRSATPPEPSVHIGSIEVRVSPPPVTRAAPRIVVAAPPARGTLSRGFASPFGLKEG